MAIPSERINDDISEVVDQGKLGACTSFGSSQAVRGAQILELVEAEMSDWIAKGGNPMLFDSAGATKRANDTVEFWAWEFPYYLARGFDHTTKEDAGTNIRTIFKAVNKYGFPALSAQPYNDNTDPKLGPVTFDKMPPAEAFREAYDQRESASNKSANVIDYARISVTNSADLIFTIKQAVAERHHVVFGTLVTEQFCGDLTGNEGKSIGIPTATDAIAGGHAMCIGGYDASGAKIINSWSKDFGGRGGLPPGWCKFSWDYITWNQTNDFWIVRRAPLLLPKAA